MKKILKVLIAMVFAVIVASCGIRELYTPGETEDYSLRIVSPLPGSTNNFPIRIVGLAGLDISNVIVTGGIIPKLCARDGIVSTAVFQTGEAVLGLRTFTLIAKDADGTIRAQTNFALYVTNNAIFVEIPDQYTNDPWAAIYQYCYGLTDDALKAALHEAINDHQVYPYTSTDTDTWDILSIIDEDPLVPANVLGVYSRRSISKTLNNTGGLQDWNHWEREHVWPNSHGFNDEDEWPPYTDVHCLRAEIGEVNGDRSDKDMAVGGTSYSNQVNAPYYLPPDLLMSSTTWEPSDEMKGDVARMLFYMAVRYEGDYVYEPNLELVDSLDTDSGAPYLGNLNDLIQWHLADPTNAIEMKRNNLVYSNYQHNRNPFIDHPEWVTNIWNP